MPIPEWLSCRDDLEDAVRTAFPLEADRFCLYAPPDTEAPEASAGHPRRIEETADGFVLVVEAFVYRANPEGDGKRRVESIREQGVRLVSRTALPLAREVHQLSPCSGKVPRSASLRITGEASPIPVVQR